jgi:uncharacterized protein (TIGR02147 family)
MKNRIDNMKDIFAYIDYCSLLKDFYEESRAANPWFSYQIFSQRSGMTSKGALFNVVSGRRRLSPSHVAGVTAAMKLNKSQGEYFEHLVAYNNARTISEKQRHFERMSAVKTGGKNPALPQLVRKDQYQYYSQWYHAIVRSLVDLYGFDGDFRKLASRVCPTITPSQAKKSVALLLNLGFIVKEADDTYHLSDKIITSAPEVISLAIHNYHLQTLEIARKALTGLPHERHNFTGVTLGISASAYAKVCKEIEEFRTRLLDLARNDDDPKGAGVYNLNLQLFSVSQNPIDRKNELKRIVKHTA